MFSNLEIKIMNMNEYNAKLHTFEIVFGHPRK